MTRQCKRCGDHFAIREVEDIHCVRCAVEVAAIIAADEKRRNRFPRAVDLTGRMAA